MPEEASVGRSPSATAASASFDTAGRPYLKAKERWEIEARSGNLVRCLRHSASPSPRAPDRG